MALIPGDPATAILGSYATPENVEKLNKQLGLDRSLVEQYLIWLGNLLQGDFGRSYNLNRPVIDEVLERFSATLILAGAALLLCSILGLLSGVITAVRQYGWTDRIVTVCVLIGISMSSRTTGKADSGLVLSNAPGPRGWRGLSRLPATALGMTPPPGLVLLSILSIQVGAALAIGLFPVLGASGTVFVRVALSAVLLLIATRLPLDRRLRDNAGLILLFGAILATMNLCFYQALARIPLGIAVTIEFLGPLAVAVATSRRLKDFLWIGLALGGVGLLTPDIGDSLDPIGVLFAAVTGACWAGFILLSGRVGRIFPGGSGLALAMESHLTYEAVAQFVARLPEEQRSVLLLVCVEGLSYREVAEITDLPVGTITSRLGRARQALKEWMERENGD